MSVQIIQRTVRRCSDPRQTPISFCHLSPGSISHSVQSHTERHSIQAASQELRGFPYQHRANKARKTLFKTTLPAAATGLVCAGSTPSILNEPRRTLPRSFDDPLACVLLRRLFSIVKDDGLCSRGVERSSFLLPYFHPYQMSFCSDLCVAIATKDVFLFQVSTLRTNIDVPLKKSENGKSCNSNNSSRRNGEQPQNTKNVKGSSREFQPPFQS